MLDICRSLGITVIELLTGHPPHDNLPILTAIYNITELDVPIPAVASDAVTTPGVLTISENLDSFLRQCLDKDPKKRPNIKRLMEHMWFRVEDEVPLGCRCWCCWRSSGT